MDQTYTHSCGEEFRAAAPAFTHLLVCPRELASGEDRRVGPRPRLRGSSSAVRDWSVSAIERPRRATSW